MPSTEPFIVTGIVSIDLVADSIVISTPVSVLVIPAYGWSQEVIIIHILLSAGLSIIA